MSDNPRIKQFLQRRMSPKDFIKEYSLEEIMGEIDHICPNYNWGPFPPWKHQAATILLALCNPRFWLILAMGSGKTYCALHAINIRRQINEIKKPTLIVCPTFVVGSWQNEVPKFTNSTIEALVGSSKQKMVQLHKNKADFVAINYAGLAAMVSVMKPVRKGNATVNKRVADDPTVRTVAGMFDCIILDESQAVKSPQAGISSIINTMTDIIPNVYALTGTPFHNPSDIWSQSYVIDKGHTFGENISLFRSAFFDKTPGYWGGWEYSIKDGMESHIHQRLKNMSIRYEDTEFEDLPPLLEQDVRMAMPPKTRTAYNKLLKEAREAVETRVIKNVYCRLRMMCGSFIDSKEDGNEMTLRVERSPKVMWLIDYLEGAGQGKQVVIFTEFIESANIINEELKKHKIKSLYMHGSCGKKNLAKFQSDPSVQALVLNSKSGAAGLNLQNAAAAVFYEMPNSVIVYKQALKRVHRSGQTKTVNHYYLHMEDSVEDKIREALEAGTSMMDMIIDGIGSF